MAVKFHCDRCHKTADPDRHQRQEGPTAAPKPPAGWVSVSVLNPENTSEIGARRNVQICKQCDVDLRKWAEPLPEMAEAPS